MIRRECRVRSIQKTRHHRHIGRRYQPSDPGLEPRHLAAPTTRTFRKQYIATGLRNIAESCAQFFQRMRPTVLSPDGQRVHQQGGEYRHHLGFKKMIPGSDRKYASVLLYRQHRRPK